MSSIIYPSLQVVIQACNCTGIMLKANPFNYCEPSKASLKTIVFHLSSYFFSILPPQVVIEARNYTGIMLIDRNDELCIMYEKCNIQEEVGVMWMSTGATLWLVSGCTCALPKKLIPTSAISWARWVWCGWAHAGIGTCRHKCHAYQCLQFRTVQTFGDLIPASATFRTRSTDYFCFQALGFPIHL